MSEPGFDFMKIWTQGDEESELKMRTVLLEGLDFLVQARSDVLSKIEVDRFTAGPVVRWMEEQGYPSAVTARLIRNIIPFDSYLFDLPVNISGAKSDPQRNPSRTLPRQCLAALN